MTLIPRLGSIDGSDVQYQYCESDSGRGSEVLAALTIKLSQLTVRSLAGAVNIKLQKQT